MRSYRHWLLWFAGLGCVLALAASVTQQSAKAQALGGGGGGEYGLIASSSINAAPVNLTTSRTLAAADMGSDFTNTGASATITLTLPDGMPVGSVLEVSQTALHDVTISFSGSEGVMIGTTAAASTISAISNGGTTIGSTFRIRKESATVWMLKFYQGSVG